MREEPAFRTPALARLVARARSGELVLGIVGLGQVGLAVAVAFAEAGLRVVGVDRDDAVVASVRRGAVPRGEEEPELPALLAEVVAAGKLLATTSAAALGEVDAVLVCVDTPARARAPVLDRLRSALEAAGPALREGALVVVESTLPPGTMDRVVVPALEASSGRRIGEGIFAGHCPERVMTGKLLANLRSVARVCGGTTEETARAMIALYSRVVRAPLEAADCVTAELVKTAENAYRDVNIAFANELARVCEASGADFPRVRALVNRSPGRDVLWAGAGVGGPCIPKDPWLLLAAAPEGAGALLRAARDVNDAMPLHLAALVEGALAEAGRALEGARVVVLGRAYLPDCGDLRGSPTEPLAAALVARGAHVVLHDPHVPGSDGDLVDASRAADALVLAVAHAAYRTLPLGALREVVRTPVLVDGRFAIDPTAARDAGFVFRALGRGQASSGPAVAGASLSAAASSGSLVGSSERKSR